MIMMEKVINLKGLSKEEIINVYKKIALKDQFLYEVWKMTGDYKSALELYEAYLKDKDVKNG